MAVCTLSTGASVIIKRVNYRLETKLEDGRIQFCQPETSELYTISRQEFFSLYERGEAEFEPRGLPTPSGACWFDNYGDKPLSEYPDKDQKIAIYREGYVKAVMAAGIKHLTQEHLEPIIKQIAIKRNISEHNRPSWISVYRWYKRYVASNCDIRSLINQRASQGNANPRVDARVTELAIAAIDETYLTLERPSMKDARDALKISLRLENKQRPPSQKLLCPSTKYLYKLLNTHWDQYTITERRYGKLAAEREYRAAVGRQERPTRPMQRVELDHMLLDLIVVDDETFLVLGRPVIAFGIDTLTRCIAGFSLGFESPSAATVMRCLKHAILPKSYLQSAYPDIKNSWECMGHIETCVFDRALENLGHRVASACLNLGIDLEFTKRRRGWGKGTVERLNRTISEQLIHIMPGTTFSNILHRGDYQPTKHAVITKSALLHAIHLWIVDIYHQNFHRGIQDSPAHKWKTTVAGNPVYLPRSAKDLEIACGAPDQKTLWHYGIEINSGLKYNSQPLTELRMKIGNKPLVDVMTYSENLGYIDVLDPTTHKYIRVPCTHPDYANNLTLYQHKMNRAFAKAQYEGRTDFDALIAAKAELRQIIKDSITKKRGTTRKRHIRYLEGQGFSFHEDRDLDASNGTHGGESNTDHRNDSVHQKSTTESDRTHVPHNTDHRDNESDYLDYEVETYG